jgi:hypothetical protein
MSKAMPKGLKGFQKGNKLASYKRSKDFCKALGARHRGIKHTKEAIDKIKAKRALQIMPKGEKASQWKGGVSSLTYLQRQELEAGRRKPSNCELCGSTIKIVFDHDHKTGKFRGWICMRCNFILGHIENTRKEVLELMFKYLEKHQKECNESKESILG